MYMHIFIRMNEYVLIENYIYVNLFTPNARIRYDADHGRLLRIFWKDKDTKFFCLIKERIRELYVSVFQKNRCCDDMP